MSNSRSNGRSPLVNQQRQITSFFTKSSASPSPSSIIPKSQSKLTPSPSPKITPKLCPTAANRNKPLLPTQSSPITPGKALDEDAVGKRVKVYWPLDKSWYEGCVKSFDRVSGKHLVQYDDSEEELLDLSTQKLQWIQGRRSVNKFRRLRKMSVVEDDDEIGGDDSTDEDWGKNVDKEVVDEEEEEESMDLDDEDEDEGGSSVKKMPAKIFEFNKRKIIGGEDEHSSSKKSKSGADVGTNKLIDQMNNDSE